MSKERGDSKVLVSELKEMIYNFNEERNWHAFGHRPKNLAMSITIEAAELMEHFQWRDNDQYEADKLAPEQLEKIRLEVADIGIYLLSFCNRMGIDLSQAVQDKVEINQKRFPVENAQK